VNEYISTRKAARRRLSLLI